MAELWSDFAAPWGWALAQDGTTPLVLALITTVLLAGLAGAAGYGIWIVSTRSADVIVAWWDPRGRHSR